MKRDSHRLETQTLSFIATFPPSLLHSDLLFHLSMTGKMTLIIISTEIVPCVHDGVLPKKL